MMQPECPTPKAPWVVETLVSTPLQRVLQPRQGPSTVRDEQPSCGRRPWCCSREGSAHCWHQCATMTRSSGALSGWHRRECWRVREQSRARERCCRSSEVAVGGALRSSVRACAWPARSSCQHDMGTGCSGTAARRHLPCRLLVARVSGALPSARMVDMRAAAAVERKPLLRVVS
jgi:hypothetical protein